MKLIFENWRRYINEEEQLDEKLALKKGLLLGHLKPKWPGWGVDTEAATSPSLGS